MGATVAVEQTFHKRLLDHLHTAVLLLDGTLTVRYLNPAAEILLSTSASRILQLPLPDYFLVDDETRGALERCVRTGHPFTRREARLHPGPNTEITVDYSVTQINEPGRPPMMLLELQQLDRVMRFTREDVQVGVHQASRAMVRGVAHELKNPLGGIRGAAQLLERALPSEELTEYTRVIIQEADRLRNIADRMLGPHRLPHIQQLNIHEVLEHVRQLLLAEQPGQIRIERDYDPSLPELLVDRDQMVQVILNLMRNALQALRESATTEGLITLRTRVLRQYTIGAYRHRLVVRVDIEDNGPGVPEEIREMLFYPMVSGRANGVGLGLSISQAIISQHRGVIECSSVPGKTLFSVFLPVDPVAEDDVSEEA